MKFKITSLAVLLLIIITGFKSDNSAYTLRLNLEKGQTYTMSTLVSQEIKQTILGQEQETKNEELNEIKYEVLDINEKGNYIIKITYERMKVKQTDAKGNTLGFDTNEDSFEDIPEQMRGSYAIYGKSLTLEMQDNGKLVDMQGFGKLLDEMTDALIGEDNAYSKEERKKFKENVSSFLGEEKIKQSMGIASEIYPPKPINTGEEWKHKTKSKTLGTVYSDNTYKLSKVQDGVAYIDISSNIKTDPDSAIETSDVKMYMDLTGKQTGRNELFVETGLVKFGSLKQDFSGEVSIVVAGEKMTFPMSIKGLIKTKILDY